MIVSCAQFTFLILVFGMLLAIIFVVAPRSNSFKKDAARHRRRSSSPPMTNMDLQRENAQLRLQLQQVTDKQYCDAEKQVELVALREELQKCRKAILEEEAESTSKSPVELTTPSRDGEGGNPPATNSDRNNPRNQMTENARLEKTQEERNNAATTSTTNASKTISMVSSGEKKKKKNIEETQGNSRNPEERQRQKIVLTELAKYKQASRATKPPTAATKKKKEAAYKVTLKRKYKAIAKATADTLPINVSRRSKKPAPQSVCGTSLAPVDYFHYPGETFMDAGRETASLPTDKMTVHRYEVLYENYFAPLRNTKYKLCEIGLGCGQFNGVGRGYELFTKYTPLVEMHGIELSTSCQQLLQELGQKSEEEKKMKNLAMLSEGDVEYIIKNWVWGSQTSNNVMDELIEKFGPFDMIIDDGSHFPKHMVTTFTKLFVEGLAPGGVYFVEDIMWPEGAAIRDVFMDMVSTLHSFMHWQFPQEKLRKLSREHPGVLSGDLFAVHQWLQRIDCEHAICAFVKRKQMLTSGNRARIPPRTDPKYWWPFPTSDGSGGKKLTDN